MFYYLNSNQNLNLGKATFKQVRKTQLNLVSFFLSLLLLVNGEFNPDSSLNLAKLH